MTPFHYIIRAREFGDSDGWFAEAEERPRARDPLAPIAPFHFYIALETHKSRVHAEEDFPKLEAAADAMITAMGFKPVVHIELADEVRKRKPRINVWPKKKRHDQIKEIR